MRAMDFVVGLSADFAEDSLEGYPLLEMAWAWRRGRALSQEDSLASASRAQILEGSTAFPQEVCS